MSPNGNGVVLIAKQMIHIIQDIVVENCELALTDEAKMTARGEQYAWLLNIEFEWPSSELSEVLPTAGPPPSVPAALVSKAMNR